ncbi:MAG: hypothetical protein AAGG07_08340 [Planctomycetota bacterium]
MSRWPALGEYSCFPELGRLPEPLPPEALLAWCRERIPEDRYDAIDNQSCNWEYESGISDDPIRACHPLRTGHFGPWFTEPDEMGRHTPWAWVGSMMLNASEIGFNESERYDLSPVESMYGALLALESGRWVQTDEGSWHATAVGSMLRAYLQFGEECEVLPGVLANRFVLGSIREDEEVQQAISASALAVLASRSGDHETAEKYIQFVDMFESDLVEEAEGKWVDGAFLDALFWGYKSWNDCLPMLEGSAAEVLATMLENAKRVRPEAYVPPRELTEEELAEMDRRIEEEMRQEEEEDDFDDDDEDE